MDEYWLQLVHTGKNLLNILDIPVSIAVWIAIYFPKLIEVGNLFCNLNIECSRFICRFFYKYETAMSMTD